MRIVAISDTHTRHRKVELPDGDVLIHAGDFTNVGEGADILDFSNWLGTLPHKHKVVIAGNHDIGMDNPEKQVLLTNCIYLQDSGVTIQGLKFYGSPFTPQYGHWAFMLPRGMKILDKWLKIPLDTDVLITHGPPKGILDQAGGYSSEHCGCFDLALVVEAQAPKLHIFGHVHGGYGVLQHKGVTYMNAAMVNEQYQPVNKPHVIDL